MRVLWLACLGLAVVPTAAALDEGAPLYLTLEDGCYDLCGGQFDYYWTDDPSGVAGKAPLTIATPAYSPYHANVDLTPQRDIEFTGPGSLFISVGCETVDPGLDGTFAWDIRLVAGKAREDFRDQLPAPCLMDVQTIEFPVDLTGGIVAAGDRLHMSISANTLNPQIASLSNLYLVADDPTQPTSLQAPWRFVDPSADSAALAHEGGSVQDKNPAGPLGQQPALSLLALAIPTLALLVRRS